MPWEAWFTILTIGLVVAALATNRVSVDIAMAGGLTVLMVGDSIFGGIVSPAEGIAGFAHPAIIMIGALFVTAAGLKETGGMEMIAQRLLGQPKTTAAAQVRLMAPVAVLSAFMNNTPIVAMYLPIINDWGRKLRISPSKLYMPLSFAAMMGGKCTLIGSASNIVVMSLYLKYLEDPTLGAWATDLVESPSLRKQFWGITALGIPTTIAGIALILLLSKWLLPERRPATMDTVDARRYEVQMMVQEGSAVVDKTIEEAGLRHLPGLYLTQIERGPEILSAVAPGVRLRVGDRLSFAGILESVIDLRKIRGLVPDTDQVEKVSAPRPQRTFVEAVVSNNSPLVGRTVRGSRFRTVYNAAIIAVHRNGQQIKRKIGDIVLQPGDTLLLDTHAGFVGAYRNSDVFYLVSQVQDTRPIRHERAWLAIAILVLLVILLTMTPLAPMVAALACAGLMVATRCVTGTIARASINWQILIVIGSALGMGKALEQTGAVSHIADGTLALMSGWTPQAMLLALFLVTTMFAQFITNYGAAVLMFPIVMATAKDLGVSPEPFVFSLIIAAGSIFLSPIGYQTNLMVYGAGGYRFFDFARIGTPLTVLLAVLTTVIAPIVFPF
jgi:di/tricarboxylate transporter